VVERSFTRRRLERLMDDALRSAGALGVRPTPLEAVARVAGIRGVEPIEHLPVDRARILGALWFAERTVFVDARQSEPRRRFTEAHELVHALCPWHEAVLRVDTEAELFRPTVMALEAEANAGAALLLFQGAAFAERIGGEPPSIAFALTLAAEHGASAHATLHELVARHETPAAMLALGRFRDRNGMLPVWRSVASPAFRARFTDDRLHALLSPGRELDELAEAARGSGRAAREVLVLDRSGAARRCLAEAYYNRHSFLVVVHEVVAIRRRAC
jgi:Zn-dependent peptidase ImmA (M78 family)